MLRKTAFVSTVALSLLSTPCLSATKAYIGFGVGPEYLNYYESARIVPPGNVITNTTNIGGTGIFGSIFGGYAWRCQEFLLAGEINADWNNVQFSSTNDEFVDRNFNSAHYKIRRLFGISVLPGFFVDPYTLFYARIGYSNANLKISTTEITIGDQNKDLNALRLGVGIAQNFTKHWSVRLDYSHTWFERVNIFGVDPSNGTTKRTKIYPTLGKVELGFVYTFC